MFTCADISQDFFIVSGFEASLDYIQEQMRQGFEWQLIVGQSGMGKTTLASYLAQQCSSPFQAVHHLQLVEPLQTADWIWQPLSGFFSGQLSQENPDYKDNVISNLEAFKNSGRGFALLIDGAEAIQNEAAWKDIAVLKNICRSLGPKFTVTFFSQPLITSKMQHPLAGTKPINLPLWTYPDVKAFINDRLSKHGIDQNVFSDEVISVINENAQGLPLRVVTLCEKAFMNANLGHESMISNLPARNVESTTYANKGSRDIVGISAAPQSLLELLRSRRSG